MHRPPSVNPDYRRNRGATPDFPGPFLTLFTRDGLDVPCRFAKFDPLFFSRRDDVANAPAERLRGGAVFEHPAGGRLEVDLAHRQARCMDNEADRAERGLDRELVTISLIGNSVAFLFFKGGDLAVVVGEAVSYTHLRAHETRH